MIQDDRKIKRLPRYDSVLQYLPRRPHPAKGETSQLQNGTSLQDLYSSMALQLYDFLTLLAQLQLPQQWRQPTRLPARHGTYW
jgi:hypothetical protein